ncbi:MAG: tyrosine-type recombinase/integrase [Nocardioidaceae bacterium]
MNTIRDHAEDYLAMRRALGFELTTFGQKLLSFIAYLETHEISVVTTEAALNWATSTPHSTDQVHWSRRLMVARIFARHLAVLDPRTEVPPVDVLPHHYRRVTPYLYTPDELDRLLDAASALRPQLRALTWHTFIALLAVTGMRTSEACRLDVSDIDFDDAVLTVRDTKFGKHRQVPVHASTSTAIADYLDAREWQHPVTGTPAVFITTRGTRLDHTNVPRTFATLIRAAAISAPTGQRSPRLHDWRHTFCVTTLLTWYRDGVDVQARLPWLSTYLGHVDPKSTYWYLTGSPELLMLASQRLEHTFGEQP